MLGLGVIKGLGITLKRFINTYVDDIRYFYFPSSATSQQAFARRQGPEGRGLFTVEYPEMKLQIPENFRFLPFLVTDYEVSETDPDFDRDKWLELNRCTSCGICSKVCPPQCIWIVRTDDPETGKPIPQPAEFFIDTDICMNCGYCAEFCPFDAIKMDHDYELADYDRHDSHVYNLERLLKSASYYASIRPNWNAREEEAKRAAEEERQRKAAEKAAAASAKKGTPAAKAPSAEAKAQEPASTPSPAAEAVEKPQSTPEVRPKRTPEEIKAQREAMMAKKQQREGKVEAGEAGTADAVEKASAAGDGEAKPEQGEPQQKKRSPEEIKAQREAMMAKRKAREGGE